ncbi:MAG: hypothetical protein AB1486_26715 [Planctomycetota bacterium]
MNGTHSGESVSSVINIYSRSRNWIEAALSNFAQTPFVLDGETIASVEGFHQGIKYESMHRRRRIFGYWGLKAKKAGSEANRKASGWVYWGEGEGLRRIRVESDEYYALYRRALLAKFTQNEQARAALLASGQARFSHRIPISGGMGVEEFEKTHLCRFLYEIRDLLRE